MRVCTCMCVHVWCVGACVRVCVRACVCCARRLLLEWIPTHFNQILELPLTHVLCLLALSRVISRYLPPHLSSSPALSSFSGITRYLHILVSTSGVPLMIIVDHSVTLGDAPSVALINNREV